MQTNSYSKQHNYSTTTSVSFDEKLEKLLSICIHCKLLNVSMLLQQWRKLIIKLQSGGGTGSEVLAFRVPLK